MNEYQKKAWDCLTPTEQQSLFLQLSANCPPKRRTVVCRNGKNVLSGIVFLADTGGTPLYAIQDIFSRSVETSDNFG